jgi:hypothetical protein
VVCTISFRCKFQIHSKREETPENCYLDSSRLWWSFIGSNQGTWPSNFTPYHFYPRLQVGTSCQMIWELPARHHLFYLYQSILVALAICIVPWFLSYMHTNLSISSSVVFLVPRLLIFEYLIEKPMDVYQVLIFSLALDIWFLTKEICKPVINCDNPRDECSMRSNIYVWPSPQDVRVLFAKSTPKSREQDIPHQFHC